MKQILQRATGEVAVVEVLSPRLLPGCVLVRIAASLVSSGTERAACEFAGKNLLEKGQSRPDLVHEVIGKIRRDGIFSAVASVRSRLDQPNALGYSSAGIVVEVADEITDISPGDRVACAGAGYAVHAEFAAVPRLLVTPIPSEAPISFEQAAFTTLGAVALHGIRTADVKLGDIVAVIGLGLVGQLTVQLLKVAGCRVVGIDVIPERADLALRMGADGVNTSPDHFHDVCLQLSNGNGADAVLIAAETSSSDPVNLAARVARDRGVVVAVGTVGMDLARKNYYEKELDFRVSRSYGPGRYDTAYEQRGRDYPIGYVRWTETRNMQAFLQLLAEQKLDLQSLITHRFSIDQAADAYHLITDRQRQSLAVVITYPQFADESRELQLVRKPGSGTRRRDAKVRLGVLGAGAFPTNTLLPAIKKLIGVELEGICAATGIHARHAAEKFEFRYCTTEERKVIEDPQVNAVVIATRHHLHTAQVLAALASGKHVFCEKPLCLSKIDLAEIVDAHQRGKHKNSLLMVGFNRRFAPMASRMKAFLQDVGEPLALHYRINAGPLPPDHWVRDPAQGGGRILSEVCHFVDLLCFLAGAMPVEIQARGLPAIAPQCSDNAIISLRFANGSLGTISYLSCGDRSFSKERIEVFGGSAVATLDDFRRLELVRHGGKRTFHSRFRQDKGHCAELRAFVDAIQNGTPAPISIDEIVASTLVTLEVASSVRSGQAIRIDAPEFITSALSAHQDAESSARSGSMSSELARIS